MAATVLTVTALSRAGVAPPAEVAGDAVNGNSVANDGRTWVEANNTDASSHTVTFTLPGMVDGQPVSDRVETLAASASARYGPFPVGEYGLSLGVTVDNALVTLAAYSLPSS